MLHRTKKEQDLNKDKYIGVGGHIEQGESPEDCIRREVKEETGLELTECTLRGVITFVIDDLDEYTFLYTSEHFTGELTGCNEGELEWVPKNRVTDLPLWEGDRIFFELLNTRTDVFSLKLCYRDGSLTEAWVDGIQLEKGEGIWHRYL